MQGDKNEEGLQESSVTANRLNSMHRCFSECVVVVSFVAVQRDLSNRSELDSAAGYGGRAQRTSQTCVFCKLAALSLDIPFFARRHAFVAGRESRRWPLALCPLPFCPLSRNRASSRKPEKTNVSDILGQLLAAMMGIRHGGVYTCVDRRAGWPVLKGLDTQSAS